ncbi:hypothetical protein Tco_0677214, partial [Tanacetum coccineum]
GKKEEDSKALITVDTLVDWTNHDGQSDGVIASKEFGMIHPQIGSQRNKGPGRVTSQINNTR